MPQLYAAGRRQVKNYLGYTLRHDFCLYTRQKASPCHRRLLATDTRREPTVFDAVMRTYLACWQGNFGLASIRPRAALPAKEIALFTRICRGPSPDGGAEMTRGIGSRSDRPPYVTGNHGKEGTDARGNRITHSATARLRGVPVGSGRGDRGAVAVDPADDRDPVLRLRRLRDLGPRRSQLDGAEAPRSAVGRLARVAAGRGASGAVSALRGAHRTAALCDGQGALQDAAGGGRGPRL